MPVLVQPHHFRQQQAAVFSDSETQSALHAGHQMAQRHNDKLCGNHSGRFSEKKQSAESGALKEMLMFCPTLLK